MIFSFPQYNLSILPFLHQDRYKLARIPNKNEGIIASSLTSPTILNLSWKSTKDYLRASHPEENDDDEDYGKKR